MKIGVRLFISSMVFAIAIAAVYGWTTHDGIGVIFLGVMALALVVVAGFIIVAEREANLAGDEGELTPADVSGETLGVFSLESYWPVLAAAATMLVLLGTVFLPGISGGLVLLGAALLVWTLRFLIREST